MNKYKFTVKRVLRILSYFLTLFVFLPSFLVSCSSQTVEVNVFTAVGGVEMYGEKVVDPHPIMLLCLLLPITILILLYIKKFADKKNALIISVCAAVDLIMWFIFRSGVKKLAEENYCELKTTAWYYINIIFIITVIAISVMVVRSILQMDEDLFAKIKGNNNTQKILDDISTKITNISNNISKEDLTKENIVGYCTQCGKPLTEGSKFCTYCGAPVVEEKQQKTEE